MDFERHDDGMISNLPMIPFQWYLIGEWESPWIDERNSLTRIDEIKGPTEIWITLSCPEEVTVDIRGYFLVHLNPIVDGLILEDVIVGPEPETFRIEFDTEGIQLDDPLMIGMRWLMRGGSEDIQIHLGKEYGTGLTTYMDSIVLHSYEIYDWTSHSMGIYLYADFYKPFESYEDWDMNILCSIDEGPLEEMEQYYSISGGDEHYSTGIEIGNLSLGEHTLRWEADYGYSSHSSGVYIFKIEVEEEPPIDDPDDDPPDDDDPPVVDDEEELWSSIECERTYLDEEDDEVTYWSSLTSDLKTDSGAAIGEDPRIDILKVEVYRENDNLVLDIRMNDIPKLGILDSGIWNTYVYFIDPSTGHKQIPMDLGQYPDITEEDYEPDQALASTSLFHSSPLWLADQGISGNSYIIKGSIASLMDMGVGSNFEILVKIQFTDLTDFVSEDSINTRVVTDYAGYGAWEVDSSLLFKEQTTDVNIGSEGLDVNIKAVAGVGIALLLIVIIVSIVLIARRKDDDLSR